jgi:hypothetical protein
VSTFSSSGINLLAPHALHLSLRPAMGTFPSASARDIPAGADEMIVTKPPPTQPPATVIASTRRISPDLSPPTHWRHLRITEFCIFLSDNLNLC